MLQKIIDMMNKMAPDLTRARKEIADLQRRVAALEGNAPPSQQQVEVQAFPATSAIDPILMTEEDADFEEDRG